MPAFAMRLPGVHGGIAFASKQVLPLGDYFKMRRVYARPFPTQMVDLHTFRDSIPKKLVCCTVGVNHPVSVPNDAIVTGFAAGTGAKPKPASLGFSYLLEKAFFKGHGAKSYHTQYDGASV